MDKSDIQLTKQLYQYLLDNSLREHPSLQKLREITAQQTQSIMQIPPEQGQFMAFLIKMLGATKALEIGTFTGYSALCIALALPEKGKLTTCDINSEWPEIGRKYWQQAGVEKKIELRLGSAINSLEKMLLDGSENSYDFAFIDADKSSYDDYYEASLKLIRAGGVIAIDNVFLFGSVVNRNYLTPQMQDRISSDDIAAIQALNQKIKTDSRVNISMLPIADGLTLVQKR